MSDAGTGYYEHVVGLLVEMNTRALDRKPIGALVEWMICCECGEKDFLGVEGSTECPCCESTYTVGCGPVGYT